MNGSENKNWTTEPSQEWGTIGGTYDMSCKELPIEIIQRKDVSRYAERQLKENDGIYSIVFCPKQSEADAFESVLETLQA